LGGFSWSFSDVSGEVLDVVSQNMPLPPPS
jgi:hypothetical protein